MRHSEKPSNPYAWAAVAVIALTVLMFLSAAVSTIRFGIDCSGHLKRAADANSIEMAGKELRIALVYLRANNLTKGGTGILWNDPSTDVEFWYKNLKSAAEELSALPEKTTPLERSNMLMKLRETILDDSQNGVHVTKPSRIALYPQQTMYAVGLVLGVIASVVLCLVASAWREKHRY
jgi:hypothetical protein